MIDSLERGRRAIADLRSDRRRIVAVDGVDGAGKSTFADAVASHLKRPVVRASIDDFHNPRSVRYRQGRESPEGYYADSFNLEALTRLLLAPFAAGEPFRLRAFDQLADAPLDSEPEQAPDTAVLILDGLFLHRRELLAWWDLSIWLDVPAEVAARRIAVRDGQPTRDRHRRGCERYIADARPAERATLVLPW
ncbi:MAG: uridine kinase [Solirubrobacteraceae bacterium]